MEVNSDPMKAVSLIICAQRESGAEPEIQPERAQTFVLLIAS
jgi:hypothetical protein